MVWPVFILGVVTLTWVLAAWTRGVIGGRRDREQAAAGFARKAGLPVGDRPGEELVTRVVRRHRFVMAGALLGFAAVVAAPDGWGWIWVACFYVGVAAGAVLARLTEPDPAAGSPRVAHATETRLTDYVPPWIAVLIPVGAAATVALGAYVLVIRVEMVGDAVTVGTSSLFYVPTRAVLGAMVGAVAAAAAAGLLARLVISRRRAAASTADLAVDDALRASAVRDCLQVSAAATFAAVVVLSQALTEPGVYDQVARRVGGWAPGVVLGVIALAHVAFDLSRGARWWRRRLHPEVAAA